MDKGSGSGIFPDPDPGDPKRPDPTEFGSGSATLISNERFDYYFSFSITTRYALLKKNT